MRDISPERYTACPRNKVITYHQSIAQLIAQHPRSLTFNMDEFMISALKAKNAAIPDAVKQAISKGLPDLPHITAMCCCSLDGVSVPPLIVLPDLIYLPPELEEFSDSGELFFASSSKGWITRKIFLILMIHFCLFES